MSLNLNDSHGDSASTDLIEKTLDSFEQGQGHSNFEENFQLISDPVEVFRKEISQIKTKQQIDLASSADFSSPDENQETVSPPEEDSPMTTIDEAKSPMDILAQKKSYMVESLDLKNMDIIDVLKLISDKSGLDIIAGKDVSGKVSLYLKSVNVMDILKIILDSHELAYSEENGIIRIMSDKDFQLKYGYKFGENIITRTVKLLYSDASEISVTLNQMKSVIGKIIADRTSNSVILMDTPEKLESLEQFIRDIDIMRKTEIFELSYAQAEEVSKKLGEIVTKNIGKVEIDARSNKLIITDIPERMSQIERIIKEIDVQDKEVLIEAKIVQIVLSDQYKMGVNWEAIVSDYHNLDLRSGFDILESTDKQGKLSIGTIADDDYSAMVHALEEIGTTNLLSSPRITVINNKEAKILVGSTEPYITSTTVTPSSGPTTTSESVNFIEVGVKLYVTPKIHNDGYVTMQIKPEVSSVTRSVSTSNNNTIPVVETSQAETTVLIKDGVTIVIGGLMKDEKIKTLKKIPFLGDIPLLGAAFRNKDDLIRKTELVIFLTPRIITGNIPSPDENITFSDLVK